MPLSERDSEETQFPITCTGVSRYSCPKQCQTYLLVVFHPHTILRLMPKKFEYEVRRIYVEIKRFVDLEGVGMV